MVQLIIDDVSLGFVWIMEHLVFLNIALSLLIILFQRKEPRTVWTWLLVLYFVPVLGFLLYLLIGQNFHKNKMFKMKEIEDEVKLAVRRQGESICLKQIKVGNLELEKYKSLILYNLNEADAVITDNNDIRIFTNGKEKFETLLNEMEHALKYIHIQYYIIRDDELWQKIETLLKRKISEGVEVRVLFDGMGCRSMGASSWKRLEEAGIKVAEFFPAVLGKFHFRVNYRNHRKIVVIDGRIGFVGGFNVGREYLGMDEKFGYWRDTHICIEGAAVTSLALRFALDWNYASGENIFIQNHLFEIPQYIRNGKDSVQIISSGPDSQNKVIRNNYLRLIYMAKRNLYIQTPYFIPDEEILDALKIAAKSGVDVQIMIPCKADHPFVYWATYSYIGDVIEAGVKCYTYDEGFLHAKCMCIDGTVTCIGTANMDIRSFSLNFEVNATIYSGRTTRKLEEAFENDVQKSTLVTRKRYQSRNMWIRIKEQFSRLLSPLM